MKTSRYTPEQVTIALRQVESGTPVPEVFRKLGVSEQTFYRWKRRFAGMGIAEVRRLRVLEEENRKLKQLVADLSLDKQNAAGCPPKQRLKPAQQRTTVRYLQVAYRVSERRACGVLAFRRSSHRYRSVADEQAALRIRLRDLAAARVSYGYRRLHVLLRREGWTVNHKRVYRLYRQEGLLMRPKKPRRHVSSQRRMERPAVSKPGQCWSIDFMTDELVQARRIRLLTIVDTVNRESPAIVVDTSIGGYRVVDTLESLAQKRSVPKTIRADNGPEFTSKIMDQWAYLHGVELDFSRPARPTDNAFIESFNARVREECLNESWFLSLEEAREKVEAWRVDDNAARPHTALGNRSPQEFLEAVKLAGSPGRVSSPLVQRSGQHQLADEWTNLTTLDLIGSDRQIPPTRQKSQ